MRTNSKLSFTICLLMLVMLLTSFLLLSPKAHASTRPKAIPPAQCLVLLLSVTNQHTVPEPKGTGEAYNIVMNVLNDCPDALTSGGSWSLVSKLTCAGQTGLGLNLTGTLQDLQPQQAENVVNQSRAAFCNEYENGILVYQFPPDQETFYGQANATTTVGVSVEGTATAYLYP